MAADGGGGKSSDRRMSAGATARPWSNMNRTIGSGNSTGESLELVEGKQQRATSVSLSVASDDGSRAAAMSVNETVNPIVAQEAASAPTAELMTRVAGAEKKIEELRASGNRAEEQSRRANERASKADARAAKAEQQLRDVRADAASANERAAKAEQELKDLRADITERFRSMEAAIALVTENA